MNTVKRLQTRELRCPKPSERVYFALKKAARINKRSMAREIEYALEQRYCDVNSPYFINYEQ